MTTSVCTIATEHGSRYLQQLCKHFAHKIPATFDTSTGRIEFPIGEVELAADANGLTIRATPKDAAETEALRDVVARHLVRFAFRETLAFDWRSAPAAG
mgnify:CR=1 FL=1